MPTRFSNSNACRKPSFLLILLCFINDSATCLPIGIVGSSEVIGSWKIMAISLPRIFCSSFSDFFKMSVPLKRIWPLSTLALLANNPMILRVVTDLPLPDSPTIAKVSPLYRSKLTSRIAWTFPAKVSKEISKFFTSKTFFIAITLSFSDQRHHANRLPAN